MRTMWVGALVVGLLAFEVQAAEADGGVSPQSDGFSTLTESEKADQNKSDGWSDGTTPVGRNPVDWRDATDPRFIKPGRFGPVAFVSPTPAIIFAYVPSYAWVFGLGAGFTYDPNGIPGPTGPTRDKFSGTVLALAEYMIINDGPFCFGPEVFFQGSLGPGNVFDRKTFAAGVVWWYAPWWNAPVLIGGAWHVQVNWTRGLDPIVSLGTPSVRFGFLWR